MRRRSSPFATVIAAAIIGLAMLGAFVAQTGAASDTVPVSWFEAHRDKMFEYFLLSIIGLMATALAITLADGIGLLPRKRTGLWRILDWIVMIAGSIQVSSSSGSGSSRSSSGSSGGGGSFGGGGSSGSY